MSPALAGRFFTTNTTWEACRGHLNPDWPGVGIEYKILHDIRKNGSKEGQKRVWDASEHPWLCSKASFPSSTICPQATLTHLSEWHQVHHFVSVLVSHEQVAPESDGWGGSQGVGEVWFSSVQSLSPVQLFSTPWTAALPVLISDKL